MSDDLERLLRDAPGRFPRPEDSVTSRVERRLLARKPQRARRAPTLALLAATFVGIAIGRWALPQDEPAIGAASAPAITIDVQPKVVSSYTSVQVTGAIVVRQKGERVRIEENACGRGWNYLKMVETDGNGAWKGGPSTSTGTDFVMPRMRTSYRAVWRGARSSAVTVAVRASVRLQYSGRGQGTLWGQVYADGFNFAGRKLAFQRLVEGRWRTVRSIVLREDRGIYSAKLRHGLPRGTQVRAALALDQARPCYAGGFSNTLTL